jgi:hypothetical protein
MAADFMPLLSNPVTDNDCSLPGISSGAVRPTAQAAQILRKCWELRCLSDATGYCPVVHSNNGGG